MCSCCLIHFQGTTVLNLKEKIFKKIPSALLFLQYLTLEDETVLEDKKHLTEYTSLKDGSIIFLVVHTPFKLFVKDSQGNMYEIIIPSTTPEVNTEILLEIPNKLF